MTDFWAIECDNDNRNVTLYTDSLVFMSKDGVVDFDFSYGTEIAKDIINVEIYVDDIEGDVFTPYLTVIGAKGLFINEQLAFIFGAHKNVDIIPLTIIYEGKALKGEWFFCNPNSALNIIDWDKSEVTLSTGGRILFVDRLIFKELVGPLPSVFRAEGFLVMPFVNESLHENLSKISSSGFELTKLDEFER